MTQYFPLWRKTLVPTNLNMPVFRIVFLGNPQRLVIIWNRGGRTCNPRNSFYFDQSIVVPMRYLFQTSSKLWPFCGFSPPLLKVCEYIICGRSFDLAMQIMPWLSRRLGSCLSKRQNYISARKIPKHQSGKKTWHQVNTWGSDREEQH